ncbi:enhancer of mRNA decapping [Rhodotorula kratochvilovae]
MATSFIGLPVLVRLKADPTASVTGTLSSLDPVAGSLTLTEARSSIGGVERLEGIRILARAEVAGLELLSVSRASGSQNGQSQVQQPRVAPQQQRRNKQHAHMQSNVLSEDFDFGAGLATFNKHAVFEQIRSNDDTDPAMRLVAHNRNPSARTSQTKLLASESVLSPAELVAQREERRDVRAMVRQQSVEREPAGAGAGGKGEERSAEERLVEVQRQMNEIAVEDGMAAELVTAKGTVVPTVTARQWKEALSIAEIESFPTSVQRIEASAHALTAYILTHLSLRDGLFPPPSPPHSRPSICLLCTDGTKGQIALRAGVTLANRGCRVVALVEDGSERSEAWRTGLRVLSSAGGRIVRDVADLAPTYNLLVDALSSPSSPSTEPASAVASPRLEPTQSFSSLASLNLASAFAPAAAAWAANIDAPLLSLDAPYGVDADSGAPSPSALTPTHLLSLGLPRPCALSPTLSGAKLALADVGLPPTLWERVGVEGDVRAVWGAEGVVELRRR